MSLYYEADGIRLYHGRCEDVLPTLSPESCHVLLTDPPYFNVKDEEWDRQWAKSRDFLAWLGTVLDAAKPALTANASAWVFAGPMLATAVEGVVADRFRVLNHIRWVKDQGWHNKAEIEAQRRYLTAWEGVIFAEQLDSVVRTTARVGTYMKQVREHTNLTRTQVASALTGYKNLESATANVCNWELGKNLISERDFASWTAVIGGVDRSHNDLRQEYESLRREYEDLRRPFHLDPRGPVTDVWNFATVPPYPGKHPCEKPLPMLRHMIGTTSRTGDVILDPFAGSGTTLLAARDMGRQSIGIEQDERWCAFTAARLSQGALFDIGGAA